MEIKRCLVFHILSQAVHWLSDTTKLLQIYRSAQKGPILQSLPNHFNKESKRQTIRVKWRYWQLWTPIISPSCVAGVDQASNRAGQSVTEITFWKFSNDLKMYSQKTFCILFPSWWKPGGELRHQMRSRRGEARVQPVPPQAHRDDQFWAETCFDTVPQCWLWKWGREPLSWV